MEETFKPIGQVVHGGKTPSFTEAEVLLKTGASARPGELLQIELEPSKHFVVGRVEEGREVNPYEAPEMARIRELVKLESIAKREDLPRKFTIVRMDLLEEIFDENGTARLREPQTVPPAGSSVFRVSNETVALALGLFVPTAENPGITVGFTIGGVAIPIVLDPLAVLPRHILIVGTTGTGKSWLLGVLMEEISKLGIPIVILDVHGEAIEATNELGGMNLTPGKELTVKLSSLSEQEVLGLMPISHELHADIVQRAFVELKKTRRPFGITELVREIQRIGSLIGAKRPTVDLLTARAEALSQIEIIGAGVDWARLLHENAIVNLDCRGLGSFQLQAVAGAVARELLSLRRKKRIPPIVLAIDEAHLFLPYIGESTSSSVLGDVIRFGRHYGACLILSTPSPTDIDRRIVRTTNTRFIFAVESDQLDALRGVFADAPNDLIARLPKLEQGTCLLTGSRETIRHAVLLKVRKRKTTHGGKTPDIVKEAREFRSLQKPEVVEADEIWPPKSHLRQKTAIDEWLEKK